MICDKCEIGGYINEEANELLLLHAVKPDAGEIREMARGWHDMCRGRGCVCQHVVGDAIDPLAISAESRRAVHATLGERFRRFLSSV